MARQTTLLVGSSNARRRAAAGFTLLELVLVLVIITVVLAIAAPSLRGFSASRQTKDAAMSILTLTKAARSEAVSQGSLCRLNVDSSTGAYWLTVQQAGAFVAVNSAAGRKLQAPEGATVSLQPSVLDGAAAEYVQFYPNGRSDVATIEVRGKRGESYAISCPSATEPYRVTTPTEGQR